MGTGARAQQSSTDAGQTTTTVTRHAPEVPQDTVTLTLSLSGTTADLDHGIESIESTEPAADLGGTLAYHHRGRRITTDLDGQSVVRRIYDTITPMGQQGRFSLAGIGARQQFHSSQSVSYTPSYLFGVLTSTTMTPELEAAASHGDLGNAYVSALALNSDLDWNWTLSRKVALEASYDVRRTTFERPGLDLFTQDIGGRLMRRLSRSVSLRGGYTYRIATSALSVGEPLRISEIAAGFDVRQPLSKGTTLTFQTGSSVVPSGRGQAFYLTGDAVLTHQMGRTWSTRIGVNRGVRLLEGIALPVLDNSFNATLAGNLQRHVTLSFSGSLSTGTVGMAAAAENGYRNFATSSGLGFLLGRRVVLDAQYFWIGDRFERGVALPPELANNLQRRGVRVNLTWRLPLVRN